jgi:gluconolactonase
LKHFIALVAALVLCGGLLAEELYVATPLTAAKSFTSGVEGPAVGPDGSIYAVNFERQQTIGRVSPDGKGEVFVVLPGKSTGNGIRFGPDGQMYVADYAEHNILHIDMKTRVVSVFAHEPGMTQPNDLTIAEDGTIYASDPDWKARTGQLWRISRDGKVTRLGQNLGTTNGVELSPDGKTLYVNESVQRKIWAYPITAEGVGEKRLLIEFPDHGFDGMRCDVEGNLYVTRHGKGTVAVVTPDGKVAREIEVLGKSPTNICFGGPDGRTAYVTEAEHCRLIQFRVEKPGLEWQRIKK